MDPFELFYTCTPPLIVGLVLLVRASKSEAAKVDAEAGDPEPPLPIIGSVRMGRVAEDPVEEDAPGDEEAASGDEEAVPIEYVTEQGACSGCGESLVAEEDAAGGSGEGDEELPEEALQFCYHCGVALR